MKWPYGNGESCYEYKVQYYQDNPDEDYDCNEKIMMMMLIIMLTLIVKTSQATVRF